MPPHTPYTWSYFGNMYHAKGQPILYAENQGSYAGEGNMSGCMGDGGGCMRNWGVWGLYSTVYVSVHVQHHHSIPSITLHKNTPCKTHDTHTTMLPLSPHAERLEGMSVQQVVDEAMVVLREMYGDDIPDPIDAVASGWHTVPTAHGTYSNLPPNTTSKDMQVGRVGVCFHSHVFSLTCVFTHMCFHSHVFSHVLHTHAITIHTSPTPRNHTDILSTHLHLHSFHMPTLTLFPHTCTHHPPHPSTPTQELGRSVGHTLHFAGEACSAEYFGYVHGAHYEGKRAAAEIIKHLKGGLFIKSLRKSDGTWFGYA